MPIPALLTAYAISTGPGAPASTNIIIIGGAKTNEERAAWRQASKDKLDRLADLFALGQGYPRDITSDTVAGLNPGYEIVVAGFCGRAGGARGRDPTDPAADPRVLLSQGAT